MVLTLLLPVRAIYGLHDLITQKHITNMCMITLATGSLVGYAYAMEFFIAWYGANSYEGFAFINRAFGNYWWSYWIMISCNVICPQLFWFKKIRENIPLVWIISIFVNLGMWFERFVIANTTLSRDFLPRLGAIIHLRLSIFSLSLEHLVSSLFFFLLFLRFLPLMPMCEVKFVMPQADPHGDH